MGAQVVGYALDPVTERDNFVLSGIGSKVTDLRGDIRDKEELKRAERLARHTEFLELAALPEFQDQFVDELEFPEI